jgi:hypothetical protein
MNMKLSSIVEYISYLVKKYGEIQHMQMQNTYRVASIKNSASGSKIIFQVIGKSTFMECTPSEILSNDAFAERFSKKDIQKITLLYAQEENRKQQPNPDLKLIRQEYNINDGKAKFILRDKKGNTTIKTAAEISLDKKIINHLTKQDAMNIGYTAGYEHSQDDSNN